jgi:hypothetical protein
MKEDEQKAAESFAVPSAMMKAGHQPKRKLGGGRRCATTRHDLLCEARLNRIPDR